MRRGFNERIRAAFKRFAPAVLLVAALLFSGCQEATTGSVTGMVTVDGTPAEMGSIAFIPLDGKSRTSGAEIVDGRYTAEVPFGTMSVEIRVPKVVGQKKLYDTPDSPMKSVMAEVLPPKYNDATELTIDVGPDGLEKDFELSTK